MEIIRRPAAALCAALALIFASAPAWTQEGSSPAGVSPGRLELLARGINLNSWFSPWSNPASYATAFHPEDAAFLEKAGFTVCRLPLDPDLLFDASQPSTLRPAIRFVDAAIRRLLDAGLAVVLDPVHGESSSIEWEEGLAHDPRFLAAVRQYWEALARHFAAISPERIFFEVMNEPHLSAREKVDPSWWGPVQESLAAAIRRGAPLNTIIVTGERWGGIDGLIELKPLEDRNVVYSFHWYEPFAFTHQAADWAGPLQAQLAGIPYPSSPAAILDPLKGLTDPRARSLVEQYGRESWNEARVRAGLKRAVDFAETRHLALFCGEFGVYRKAAPPVDRLRWIGDVRRSLESTGVGWCMWDYETDFGLVTYAEPSWRRGIRVDPGCLAALGLDASQVPAPRPGEATAADFSSGAARSLDIPVDAWKKLWTRDPGTGETTVEEEGGDAPVALSLALRGTRDWALESGLRIAVRAGEKLALSSRASLAGTGSLGLEAVARDAAGNVVNWSLGGVRVEPGRARAVTARLAVPLGVATVEPRWSGSGSSQVRVEAFRLEHVEP